MARLIPSLPLRAAFGAGAYAELAFLHTLEQGLSGTYSPRLTWLSSYYLYSNSSMSAANGMGAQGRVKASG